MVNTILADRYRLDRPVGGGGAASVWRALDTRLGRPVAVKRLHARLREDDRYAERFAREAEVVSAFDHPGIVALLDRGEDESGAFLVFELIDGDDLKTLIGRAGRLLPETAAETCAQVADALAYAHRRGVVHRDVKSQNVLITRDGRAKLTDFGIAYLLDMEGASELTRTGTLVGTTDYLAPEQATGRPVDARADIYALGVVVYECLTGELPYRAENPLALALCHVQDPFPDARERAPDVPGHLALVVARATAKDPAGRFQTASGFAGALRDAASIVARGTTMLLPELDFLPPSSRVADPPGSAAPGGPAERADEAAPSQTRVMRGDIDPEEETGPMATVRSGRHRRRRRFAAGAAVALAAGGATAGVLLTRGGGGGPTAAGATALRIVSATATDPRGDGHEHDAEARLAIDGATATSWSTERYRQASLAYKGGVGLRLALAAPARATALTLVSPTPGAAFQVRAVSASGAETIVGRGRTTGARQRVALNTPAATRDYVLWFTTLPPDGTGGYRARVAEVSLAGTG